MTQTDAFLSRFTAGAWEITAAKSAFFVSGFAFTTWVMFIPSLKQRLSVEADVLGLLLLCIGASACFFMPLAGILSRHLTCRALLCATSLIAAADLLVIPHLPALWMYVPALLVFGGCVGTLDVAINLNGVVVEQVSKRHIMSGMHAFYSVGCFVGAGLFSLLAKTAGLSDPWIAAVHVGIILVLLAVFSRYFLAYRADGSQKSGAVPKGAVIFLGVMACISFLSEGAVMDWGGVLLSEDKGVPLASAGLGLTAFSLSELLGRLFGDSLVRRFGPKMVVIPSAGAAACCFAAVGLSDALPMLVFFFFLLGFAVANIVPVMYTLIEKQQDMPIHAAVTAVTAMGYAGVLLGPSILGFIAHRFHIAVVFDSLAVLVLFQTALALYIFRRLR